MSILKQVLLSLVVVVVAAGAWLFYQRPEFVFGQETATESAAAPARGAGPGGASGNRTPGGPGQAGGGGRAAAEAVTVVTAPVVIDTTGIQVRAIGTAAAVHSVTLYPQVTGVVIAKDFSPGQDVAAGQELIRLDSSDQQIAVDLAKLALDAAKEALARAQRLQQTGNVTAVVLSDARTAEQKGEIDLRSAELELAKRTVRAPFAGVVGLSDISVGDLVNSSKAIATLDDMTTVTVAFDVPENVAGKVAVGQSVAATTSALPGVTFAGTISAVDSRLDPATRTLKLEVALPNEARALKPGMAVTIDLSIPGEPRPAVPSLAIQWDRQGSFVWVVDDGVVHRTPVQIVTRRSGVVTVAADLAEGTPVVTEGVLRLREGLRVTTVGDGQPAAPQRREPQGDTPVSGGEAAAAVGQRS